jgi:hypothetical protein
LGSFLQRLELGVVKRKGLPYDHHDPGKIERAHQTIMQLGRAIHKESKLPRKYYPLCHSAAVYILISQEEPLKLGFLLIFSSQLLQQFRKE